jgi:cytochrome c553
MMVEAPNLAVHHAVYLEEQLRNHRSGKRSPEVTSMATWFSSIRLEVTVPH